jgi:hypothetical protein
MNALKSASLLTVRLIVNTAAYDGTDHRLVRNCRKCTIRLDQLLF